MKFAFYFKKIQKCKKKKNDTLKEEKEFLNYKMRQNEMMFDIEVKVEAKIENTCFVTLCRRMKTKDFVSISYYDHHPISKWAKFHKNTIRLF
ncbi:hypothetical protein BLOT_005121 [Blomia tropicalis]|nr:hypothetical protein BLOT_005121 [Blomia tropicalis]